MFKKANQARDAFTFSLGGMRAIASFSFAPAIADDRFVSRPDKNDRRRRIWTPADSEPALENR